jgi:anti-sigma regulatory factor (Ser/Thr protein kinase)
MSVERQFGRDRTSAAAGRQFVCDATADLPEEIREQIVLMVSELATNSLVHAATGFEIRIDRSDSRLRIEVTDVGGGQPALRSPGSREPHGRGLQIVKALSDRWGTSETSEQVGKTVWFEIGMHPAPRSAPVGAAGQGRTDGRRAGGGSASRPDPTHQFSLLRSALGGRRHRSPWPSRAGAAARAVSVRWCFIDVPEVHLEYRG